jgi:hypothetical protein
MRTTIVVTAALCAAAGTAHAGKKVKAEFLCGVFVDGNVTDMVPSPKKPKLDQPIGCAIHIDDMGGADTYMANIHTVRTTVDASGKKSKVTTTGHSADIDASKDLELVMTPGANDENNEIDFQSCEDFDVVASVYDAAGKYFTKTLHVAQACPKPKPLKAKVGCYATNDAGNRVDLPDKKKPSLDGYKLTCWGMSTDERFNGTGVKFSAQTEYYAHTMNDTDGHTVSEARYGNYEEGEDESSFAVELPTDDVPVCLGSFDIHIAIDDPSTGVHLFGKTITVKQICN